MALVRIAGFGKAGINTDTQPTLLQPGEWTWLENIDIESGDIRSAWGDSLLVNNPPVNPKFMYVYEGEGDTYLIISDGNYIYAFEGNIWADISPEDVSTVNSTWDDGDNVGDGTWDGGDSSWDLVSHIPGTPSPLGGNITFDVFLGTLIMTPSFGVPAYWPDTSQRMEVLPGWNTSWRAQTIVSYSNFLVALGLDDGSIAGAKYRVAWSDAAAQGEIPQSWTPTPENLAGSEQLRDTSGYLVTAKILRDELMIYKNDSIYRMFLRDDEFVMGFERIINDRGCDSINGVAALGGVHFFADRGDVRAFDGQITKSVAVLRIKERLTAGISNEYRDATIVVSFPERDEIWVGVVPAGGSTLNYVIIYNTLHNSWTLKAYPSTVSMIVGPFSLLGTSTLGNWDDTNEVWDGSEDHWNQSAFDPSEDSVIFGSSSNIWRADKSNTDYEDGHKNCIAERVGFLIDKIPPKATIRGVYPEMKGNATVDISIGWQMINDSTVKWTNPKPFTIGVDKRVKCRVTGQPVGFKIESAMNASWRLGALTFDIVQAGGR